MALNFELKSKELFEETEKPKQPLPKETQKIIRDRYELAASLAQGCRVVEVGAGSGVGLRYLAKSSKILKCLEYSQENFELISSKFSKTLDVCRGDAHQTPFEDNEFDLAVALAMVYYLSINKFLKEMRRILDKDGTLFFCTSNRDVPGFVPSPFTTEYHSIPELDLILRSNGFEPTFFGVFPTSNIPFIFRYLRAFVKDLLKSIFCATKFGQGLWNRIRQLGLKDISPLPDCVTDMEESHEIRVPLEGNKVNTKFRVIYVVARKTVHDH